MSEPIKKCPKRLFIVVQMFPMATNSVNNIFSLPEPKCAVPELFEHSCFVKLR